MKPKLYLTIFLIGIVVFSTGFVLCEKDEKMKPEYTVFQTETCFAEFLTNLKKMDALIFIPENKLKQAQSFNLLPFAPEKAKRININFTEAYEFYGIINPTDNPTVECSKSVVLNFNNLEMKVFVKNDRLKVSDELRLKLVNSRPLNPKNIELNNSANEVLKIKLNNSSSWVNLTPVELK